MTDRAAKPGYVDESGRWVPGSDCVGDCGEGGMYCCAGPQSSNSAADAPQCPECGIYHGAVAAREQSCVRLECPYGPHAIPNREAIDFSKMEPPDEEAREWMDAPMGPPDATRNRGAEYLRGYRDGYFEARRVTIKALDRGNDG